MKLSRIAGCALAGLALAVSMGVTPAQAEATMTPSYVLKSKGIDIQNTNLVSFSPDNHYVCMFSKTTPDPKSKKFVYNIYILTLQRNGGVESIRTYALDKTPDLGQICFTPDSKAIVYTTLQGTKFIKLDLQTGERTTIMEHVKGQPGFVNYPATIIVRGDKMLATGYFYTKDDVGTRDSIVELRPDKTGLDAFVDARLIDHVKRAVTPPGTTVSFNFPALDVGFLSTVHAPDYCEMFSWDGDRDLFKIEDVKELHSYWCGGNREAYSVKTKDDVHKLCVYDAKTDEKITIADTLHQPYWYVFLSGDGKTAMFSEGRTGGQNFAIRYARESEGWQVNSIDGMEKPVAMGKERLSLDGSRMALFNKSGLYIADVEAGK